MTPDHPSIVDDVQYMVTAAISALSLPLTFLARREKAVSDPITRGGDGAPVSLGAPIP